MGQIITTADAVATLRRLDHTDVYNVERVITFIERQAETIRTMAAVLTKPSPGIDDASAAAAEIVARTASQNMVADEQTVHLRMTAIVVEANHHVLVEQMTRGRKERRSVEVEESWAAGDTGGSWLRR